MKGRWGIKECLPKERACHSGRDFKEKVFPGESNRRTTSRRDKETWRRTKTVNVMVSIQTIEVDRWKTLSCHFRFQYFRCSTNLEASIRVLKIERNHLCLVRTIHLNWYRETSVRN